NNNNNNNNDDDDDDDDELDEEKSFGGEIIEIQYYMSLPNGVREVHEQMWKSPMAHLCVFCHKCCPQQGFNRWYALDLSCSVHFVLSMLLLLYFFVVCVSFVSFNPLMNGQFEEIYLTEEYSLKSSNVDDKKFSEKNNVATVLVGLRNWEQTFEYKMEANYYRPKT
ncbi:hypothetical protein RFI_36270, partial [Reticulomyxa filosa]